MSTPNTVDILGICERLKDDQDYKDFCEYLVSSFKGDTFEMMIESEQGSNKITAEHYAKAKVYNALADLPYKIILALRPPPKQKEKEVYR